MFQQDYSNVTIGNVLLLDDQKEEWKGVIIKLPLEDLCFKISTTQDCCEYTDFFCSLKNIEEIMTGRLIKNYIWDVPKDSIPNTTLEELNITIDDDELNMIIMKVCFCEKEDVQKEQEVYFIAMNKHNGYYAHSVKFERTIKSWL